MTAADPAVTRTHSRAANRTLWTIQIVIGVFLVVASAAPKLFGEAYAVEIFTQIGAGQWFRYLVGILELAGGVGLLVPRLAGPAALGLVGLMVGAAITQAFVLGGGILVLTPVLLLVLVGVVAWGRRDGIAAFLPSRGH
jgi:putative oxidoreductase